MKFVEALRDPSAPTDSGEINCCRGGVVRESDAVKL